MLKNLFIKLIYNGIQEDDGLKLRSRSAVFNSISIVGVIILSIFTVVDIIENEPLIAAITGATSVLILFSLVIVGLSKKLSIGTTFISYLAFVLFLSLIYTQGAERAGYFWMMLFPLISIFFLGIIHGTVITAIFGVMAWVLMFKVPGLVRHVLIIGMAERALGAYIGVTIFTASFEIIRIKAFSQLEKTSEDLVEKRRQTTMILNNVKQGIFLLNESLEIAEERSEYFNELFSEVSNTNSFIDLIKGKLPERDFIATKDYLELFFNKTVNPTLLGSINPIDKVLMNFRVSDAEVSQVWLEFDFERIVLKNGDVQILGLFRDVTERVLLEEQLEKEESESLQNMENLFQIIHINPELMDEFLKDTNDEINKINELLKVETDNTGKVIELIFTMIHGIKGNALLLGLKSLGSKLQDFEDYTKELMDTNTTWRELLRLTVNLADLKHDINKINELIEKIISFQKDAGEGFRSKNYIFEESLKKSLVKLGEEFGKDVELDTSEYNNDIIPEKYRRLFKDSINQFVRNSIAHGIETPDERIRKDKLPVGKIKLSIKKVDDKIEFIYRDDGAGLSVEKIKEAAIRNKGFTPEKVKELTSSEAVKLIFHPGFSTKDSVTSLAGQGIGMNVIKNHVDKAGGKLNIRSSSGKFCEFKIVLQN